MQSTFQAATEAAYAGVTDSLHSTRGRSLAGILDPGLRTFTITMPSVGVFLFGTALICYCCFKYGLQRWYEKTLIKARTRTKTGITYAESLQHKKNQLDRALEKVMKLRKVEPSRLDLKYEGVALKEGIRMLNEHLRNSQRYADYCESIQRPGMDGSFPPATLRTSFYDSASSSSQQQEGSPFVTNPMFSSQQAVNSGYLLDPVKLSSGPTQFSSSGSPSSSDEECHNPRHKALELYLMSTGGTIRPSLLKFPETVAEQNRGFPSGNVYRSRRGSPLRKQEIDGEGRSVNISPPLQRERGSSIESSQAQTRFPDAQPRPGMSQTWQPDKPIFGSISSPGGPNNSPSGGPSSSPIPEDNTYRGTQPRVSA